MHNCTVCVADDCIDEVNILCDGLKLHNYEAVPAHTGQEALEVCRAGRVDLILLDIGLPDIDGYEVCRQLKTDPKTEDIAVIFVTAKGAAEDVAHGYDLGAVEYIAKPYNLPMVMVAVDGLLRTSQRGGISVAYEDYAHDPAYTDDLTGLRNRRYLLERLQEEVEKAHRFDYPLSCLLLDVDEVVPMDDELGAAALDDLLVEIAMTMRNASRGSDILARYDGALLAAVLPHTTLEHAMQYASKLQSEVGATTFSDPSFPTQAKLCFGIVSCRNGAAKGAEHLLSEAMRSLWYASTHNGNRLMGHDLNTGKRFSGLDVTE
mgnify:CR=1 FL=1